MPQLTYCVSCKKKTTSKNPKIIIVNGKSMIKSICSVCGNKKSTFISSKKNKL